MKFVLARMLVNLILMTIFEREHKKIWYSGFKFNSFHFFQAISNVMGIHKNVTIFKYLKDSLKFNLKIFNKIFRKCYNLANWMSKQPAFMIHMKYVDKSWMEKAIKAQKCFSSHHGKLNWKLENVFVLRSFQHSSYPFLGE